MLDKANPLQLDLEYLIGMQNLGFDVLKYFKLDLNNSDRAELSTKEQMLKGARDIKLLISSCY